MNPVAISIGPLSIAWYSICILLGAIVAYLIIIKEAKKHNISVDFITNLVFWSLCLGILGARVYYVLFNLDYYSSNPSEIIKIWNGGLAIHGGIIVGIIVVIASCKIRKQNVFKILDISVVGVIMAQAIGRWGNFFNQEAHGGMVTKAFLEKIHIPKFIINGMYIDGSYYHPTFLYESLLCIIGFIVMLLARKYIKKLRTGSIFSIYLIWYGLIRFFIESLRTDSLMLGNLKMAQLISVVMIITGIAIFIISMLKNDLYNNEDKAHK